ncbi:MAG: hypothetical protein P8186_28800 [Anaerolineae bacterium]|jgi:hypothetical protein
MKSPNSYYNDELERLVQETLQAWVGTQAPPKHVWKRIRLELEIDKSPPPRRFRLVWRLLVVKSALISLPKAALKALSGKGVVKRLVLNAAFTGWSEQSARFAWPIFVQMHLY